MDKTLELFKLFHYLKEVTSKSYSLKKLQDVLERKLDSGEPVNESEFNQVRDAFFEVFDKLTEALDKVEDIIQK